MGEFDVIKQYFMRPAKRAVLGVGDDCALLQLSPGMQLATSNDMLVEGRHFFANVAPEHLGHKALAVNLSDLAACGAQPLAFMLALSVPHLAPNFLAGFSKGLWALADAQHCELIGGDTVQGPLNICITVFGTVPFGQALLRSGARVHDDIYVSGTLGDARLALESLRGQLTLSETALRQSRRALEQPQPRVNLGLALRGIASSAIDLSDGLLADLQHILQASGVGAGLDIDAVPRSILLAHQPQALQRLCTLAGGDDYELLFTAPPLEAPALQAIAKQAQLPITRIGQIQSLPGLRLLDAQRQAVPDLWVGFDHFRQ
jgi:thiamine-monophosphate kinase